MQRPKCEYLSYKGVPCGAKGRHYAHIPVGPGSQTETMIVCDVHAESMRRDHIVTWQLRRNLVPGTWTRVPELPSCDLCSMLGVYLRPARYDGATVHGPWAYMCEAHFKSDGLGLGTGRGQRLVLPTEKDPKE